MLIKLKHVNKLLREEIFEVLRKKNDNFVCLLSSHPEWHAVHRDCNQVDQVLQVQLFVYDWQLFLATYPSDVASIQHHPQQQRRRQLASNIVDAVLTISEAVLGHTVSKSRVGPVRLVLVLL